MARGTQRPRSPLLAATAALCVTACGAAAPAPPTVCAQRAPLRSVRALQCGPTLDFTPINAYQGPIAAVADREDAVALIGGTCTGTLIAASAGPVVLTAGHCAALGDRLVVAFNVEAEPDGDPLVTEGTVIESSAVPDYALLRLDALPAAAPTPLTTRRSGLLAIIQHPRGQPKVVAEGALLGACHGKIFYGDLDTLVGSSGAGLLNASGHLLGVHTDGDCAGDGGGANWGWTAEAIVAASRHLQGADIGDR